MPATAVVAGLAERHGHRAAEGHRHGEDQHVFRILKTCSQERPKPAKGSVNVGVAAVVKAFGGVDILVSNAGIQIVHPLEEFSYAEWKKLMAIHVDGAFLTTRACATHAVATRQEWGAHGNRTRVDRL